MVQLASWAFRRRCGAGARTVGIVYLFLMVCMLPTFLPTGEVEAPLSVPPVICGEREWTPMSVLKTLGLLALSCAVQRRGPGLLKESFGKRVLFLLPFYVLAEVLWEVACLAEAVFHRRSLRDTCGAISIMRTTMLRADQWLNVDRGPDMIWTEDGVAKRLRVALTTTSDNEIATNDSANYDLPTDYYRRDKPMTRPAFLDSAQSKANDLEQTHWHITKSDENLDCSAARLFLEDYTSTIQRFLSMANILRCLISYALALSQLIKLSSASAGVFTMGMLYLYVFSWFLNEFITITAVIYSAISSSKEKSLSSLVTAYTPLMRLWAPSFIYYTSMVLMLNNYGSNVITASAWRPHTDPKSGDFPTGPALMLSVLALIFGEFFPGSTALFFAHIGPLFPDSKPSFNLLNVLLSPLLAILLMGMVFLFYAFLLLPAMGGPLIDIFVLEETGDALEPFKSQWGAISDVSIMRSLSSTLRSFAPCWMAAWSLAFLVWIILGPGSDYPWNGDATLSYNCTGTVAPAFTLLY